MLVREPDGEEWTFIAATLEENSQGFVDVRYYDTVEEAEKVWARLERHWKAWGREEEEQEEVEAPSQEDINEAVNVDDVGGFMVAYYERKKIVEVDVEDEREFWAELRAWAKKEDYWPDIYSVNDHGNVTAYDYDGNVVGEWV